jgi:hypothetical protein
MHNHDTLLFIIKFILNGFLHVTFLFSFLFILYYYIIAPLTESSLKDLLGSTIDNLYDSNFSNITISLSKLFNLKLNNKISEKFDYNNINIDDIFKLISDNNLQDLLKNNSNLSTPEIIKLYIIKYIYDNQYIMNNYLEQNSTTNQLVVINNQSVLFFGAVIAISLTIISALLFTIFKYTLETDINILEIILENILTFTFVGTIEYWFFTTYAFNYIPMPASLISTNIIDKIKELLSQPYVYTHSTDIPPIINKHIPIVLY